MYDIPFDRSFLQLSNGIRHVMLSTDRKLELTAKASMAQPVSQPAVCCNGLMVHEVAFPSRKCVFSCMNTFYGSESLFCDDSIGTAFISNCIRVGPTVLQLKLAGT